jgi:arylsulfatase A-like enzyme
MPGRIPAGTRVSSIAQSIDFLPTFCRLAEKAVPSGLELDGRDIWDVLAKGAASPHDQLVLFDNEEVVGIRTQDWKYVASTYYRSGGRMSYSERGYDQLYDVKNDPSENYSVAADHPDVLADMKRRFEAAKKEFGPLKSRTIPPFFAKQRERLLHSQD